MARAVSDNRDEQCICTCASLLFLIIAAKKLFGVRPEICVGLFFTILLLSCELTINRRFARKFLPPIISEQLLLFADTAERLDEKTCKVYFICAINIRALYRIMLRLWDPMRRWDRTLTGVTLMKDVNPGERHTFDRICSATYFCTFLLNFAIRHESCKVKHIRLAWLIWHASIIICQVVLWIDGSSDTNQYLLVNALHLLISFPFDTVFLFSSLAKVLAFAVMARAFASDSKPYLPTTISPMSEPMSSICKLVFLASRISHLIPSDHCI